MSNNCISSILSTYTVGLLSKQIKKIFILLQKTFRNQQNPLKNPQMHAKQIILGGLTVHKIIFQMLFKLN